MTTLNSIRSLTLDLPPSCIQFCPDKPHLFVVGTYFLHAQPDATLSSSTCSSIENAGPSQETQKRTGSLVLYELSRENTITELSTTASDFAILDIQWSPHPERLGDLLAVATSTGLLAFYRLQTTSDITQQTTDELVLSCVKRITPDDKTLVLSLTWHADREDVLGLTLYDGRVCICTSSSSSRRDDVVLWSEDAVIEFRDVHEHELEAWMMSFTPESSNVLSGGDDMTLQCSHMPPLPADTDPEHVVRGPLWQDRRLHQAGVTAILPITDTLVVTGSYDDHIRLLSLPDVGRKKILAELNLGGGVWRLKLLSPPESAPSAVVSALRNVTSFVLLCSCMHAGTRIVKMTRQGEKEDDDWEFRVLAKFEEHQSMNYGSDIQPSSEEGKKTKTIISTSFYDKLMCLWTFDLVALEKEP